MNNKIVAIIPARAESKGLPGKNIKSLLGKPMIAYTIEAALKSKLFSRVIVSTDKEEYADIARKHGAEVPFLRPEHLAGDDSHIKDTIIHLLDWLEESGDEIDSFMLLQPTSPLRTEEDVKDAVEMYNAKDAKSVVSVCEAEHNPAWMNSLGEDLSLDGFVSAVNDNPRQKLQKYYRLNGAIYLSNVQHYKKHQSFYSKEAFASVMPAERSVDVDSELDFQWAEFLLNKLKDEK